MVHHFPDFTLPIARLLELADAPFDAPAFKAACEAFGSFDMKGSDESLWWFDVSEPEGPRLMVGIEDDRITFAILPVCWWDAPLEGFHESRASYQAEKAEFAESFAELLGATVDLLGPPWLSDTGPDVEYRHALWRRPQALFILQHSNMIGQGEDDIHYWISPWTGPDPVPTDPFMDWICRARPGDDAS